MVTRMFLSDGSAVYPNFLGKEERIALRGRLNSEGLTLRCSCRDDIGLLYGISEDCRIIPLHQHYEHKDWCSRNPGNILAPVTYDDDGNSVVKLKFNALSFNLVKNKGIAEEEGSHSLDEADAPYKEETTKPEGGRKKKAISYGLPELVKTINRETYAARISGGKQGALSADYYWNAVLGHLSHVSISGLSKSLKQLSIEKDGICFFYNKVSKISGDDVNVCFMRSGGKEFRRYVPEHVLSVALKHFRSMYGVGAEEYAGKNLYAAGFSYRKVSRNGNAYICAGRLHLFLVSDNGIYASNMLELEVLNALFPYARRHGGTVLFPDSDRDAYFCSLRIVKQRKEGIVCLGKNPPVGHGGPALCVRGCPEEYQLDKFVDDICFM